MTEGVPHSVPVPAANPDAFERHVLPEVEVLFRVARSLTRNDHDAEDLVQDTLLRAHRSIGTFDGRHPRAWLLTILRNTHINRNRRQRPQLMRDPDNQLERNEALASPARTDEFIDQTFDAAIEEALRELSEPFRRVIELVDVNGCSYAEASDELGVPVGTVMSRLHRARQRMRERLAHSGIAPRSPR